MSEEEDCEDLPPISVNSSNRDSSSFSMPSAGEVATQRARAAHCEQQLIRLREEHDAATAEVAALMHSDSSGSEGEAALSAAVGALHVKGPRRIPPPAPAHLLSKCMPHFERPVPRLLREYLNAASQLPDAALLALDDEMARGLMTAATDLSDTWEDEACGVALWVLAAVAARRSGITRLAHALLDDILDESGAVAVATAVNAGVRDPRDRLALVDALTGGGPRARELAARLAHVEMTSNDAASRYIALQAAARSLAASGPDATDERRSLAALLATTRPRDTCPDSLKVVVAATKLRVLFDVAE